MNYGKKFPLPVILALLGTGVMLCCGGTTAVGLFNRDSQTAAVAAKWSDLGLEGRQPVRDLWQQKNLGVFADSFSTQVPPHGAVLVKVGKANRAE